MWVLFRLDHITNVDCSQGGDLNNMYYINRIFYTNVTKMTRKKFSGSYRDVLINLNVSIIIFLGITNY